MFGAYTISGIWGKVKGANASQTKIGAEFKFRRERQEGTETAPPHFNLRHVNTSDWAVMSSSRARAMCNKVYSNKNGEGKYWLFHVSIGIISEIQPHRKQLSWKIEDTHEVNLNTFKWFVQPYYYHYHYHYYHCCYNLSFTTYLFNLASAIVLNLCIQSELWLASALLCKSTFADERTRED